MRRSDPRFLLRLMAAWAVLTAVHARGASMSASVTAPVVDGGDLANFGTIVNKDKFFADESGSVASRSHGQTVTTGDSEMLLRAVTFQVGDGHKAEPTKEYVIRVGTVEGNSVKAVHSESATQSFTWNSLEYMTWTFDEPVPLSPNTLYGVDVVMTNSTSGWSTGIPYLTVTADEYTGGTRYLSETDAPGLMTYTIEEMKQDRVFHLDLDTGRHVIDSRFLLIP